MVYYIIQSVIRIVVQFYITKRFYAGDESLGRQAQAASAKARELSESDGGGGGLIARAKRELEDATGASGEKKGSSSSARPTAKGSNSRTNGGTKGAKGRPQASKNANKGNLQRPGGQRKR